MKLTPQRARGKRGASREANPVAKRSKKMKGEKKKPETAKTPRIPPKLECMPVEVLQQIFVLSENLAFPLTSRSILKDLSANDQLQMQLIIAACGPTWAEWYGIPLKVVNSYDGWHLDYARFSGNPVFQSRVLSCRWATLDVILSAYELWIKEHSKDRMFFATSSESETREETFPTTFTAVYAPWKESLGSVRTGVLPGTSTAKATPVLGVHEAFKWKRLADHQDINSCLTLEGLDAHVCRYINVHPNTRIPPVLLQGPFTWDRAYRLLWFILGGVVYRVDCENWEVTYLGWQRMLTEAENGDFRLSQLIFSVFMYVNVFEAWPDHICLQVLQEAANIAVPSLDEAKVEEWQTFIRRLISFILEARGVLEFPDHDSEDNDAGDNGAEDDDSESSNSEDDGSS